MRTISILVAAAWVGIVTAGCAPQPITPLAVGERAPQFELAEVAGDGRLRSDTLEGEIVVVNFWSTTCLQCVAEIDELKSLHADGAAKVVGIALDDDAGRVESLVERKGIEYPVLLGDQNIFERYDGFSIPYTVVIDRDQVVRKRYFGPPDFESLRTLLQQLDGDAKTVANADPPTPSG